MLATSTPTGRKTALCLISISLALVALATLSIRQHVTARGESESRLVPAAGPLTLLVNTLGDAADTNVGDAICDSDVGTVGDQCTFRAAIQETNAAATGTDVINFSLPPNSIITLNNALPGINGNLTINGPGASLLTIQRNAAGGTPDFRILTIGANKTVNLSGLTVSNGKVPFSNFGGGILNAGTLTIIGSNISNNSAQDGGGIFNGSGGSGSLTIINSTISGNSSVVGSGGGIESSGSFGSTFNLINSTVSSNTSDGSGGGIAVGSPGPSPGFIINSTISNNSARNGGGGLLVGNGTGFTVNLVNSTITGNRANSSGSSSIGGGGILKVFSVVVNLRNTIVAGNFSGIGTTADDIPDTVDSSSSFNLIGTGGSGGLTNGVNNNQVGVSNQGLGPLADNGGPTQTHALLPGSPALDMGNNSFVTNPPFSGPPFTDQRGTGFNRIVDGPDADTTAIVDIGAWERQVAFVDIPDTTSNEDSVFSLAFEVDGFTSITSITATSSDATLVPNNPGSINVAVAGSSSTRILTVTPTPNLFGTSTITITINTASSSTPHSFLLTVNSVNDAPSFTKGPDQTVNEDAGLQTINDWATNISAGPLNESGQTTSFVVTNNNNALFSGQPAVSPTGTLTYTPAPDANGSATVSVTLKDDGGTANGGEDTSVQTFTITVNPVNDAPSFTKGPDQTVNNDAGSQTVNNWATNILAGPANESGQTVSFQVTGNSNPGLFAVAPAISATGRLTYRPALNAGGAAIITIVLQDSGGTSNGGQNTSFPQTFTINVNPVGGFLKFNVATSSTTESSGFAMISVKRMGDTSLSVSVDYATSGDNGVSCSTANGVASSKCDFTSALGTLKFASGEDTKTFTVLISQDSYVEGSEDLTLSLSNQTGGAALSSPSIATLTINDDVTEPPTNPIDDPANFVRQHYHDFLNREPDQAGLDFWTNQITSCGSNQQCTDVRRINVSAAFYLSIEFQGTGYLVERIYKAAYGDAVGTSTFNGVHQLSVPVVRLNEFLSDTQEIGLGVVVNQGNWQQQLENNKQAFCAEFVQRSRFTAAFSSSMTPAEFVDKLNTNAGNPLSTAERNQLVTDLSTNAKTRAQVLRAVAEDADLNNAEFNRAFVLMQYFGYLRRNPNDPQDTDYTGYDFWLTKLNIFTQPGDDVLVRVQNAEMVKAFIVSAEYRNRFGP